MFIIYDLIFLVFAAVYLPVYLLKRKFHKGFLCRLGFLPPNLALNRPIWCHAVSVGEAMAVKGLIAGLREVYPKKNFVISTVTITGNKIARGIARENDLATYLPLDISFIVSRVIGRIDPALFIIAETEIWPNLIRYLSLKNIPIVVVNGRISDRSFGGYRRIRFLLKPVLNKISLFCVQTENDAARLISLGVSENKIKVTGNMKFDIEVQSASADIDTRYRQKLDLGIEEQFLVAASTHPNEEELILKAYRELKKKFPGLRLLIAPRHPERSSEVAGLIRKAGFTCAMISTLTAQDIDKQTIFILDTIGQLIDLYAVADIVFVGGSLVKKGGHNILEPAALGKPILFGPYMFNFRDIAGLFLNKEAAVSVRNQEELKGQIEFLLSHPEQREELGFKAKKIISEYRGATLKNIKYLNEIFPL
ncbi:MAG: 3-deoxy-D-manno-octulosonic acid transferase [Candidatus Omnitrophica bacterium]|nr:3-deoxy-D-manno-octulosonic acid transferase [Candidatus Omnitrophota bacterium]